MGMSADNMADIERLSKIDMSDIDFTHKKLELLRARVEELTAALGLEMAEHDRTRKQKDILLKLLGKYYDRA